MVFATTRPERPVNNFQQKKPTELKLEPLDEKQLEKYAADIRDLIQHEDTVQNYRFTWFSAFQALLFAATGAAWDKTGSSPLIYVICLVGVVSARSSLHALRLSDEAYSNLESWWDKRIKTNSQYFGPGRQGTEHGKNLQFMPSRVMPVILMASWVLIGLIRFFQRCMY